MRRAPSSPSLVHATRVLALGALLGTASCARILGLDEFEDCDEDSCSGVLWAKSFRSHELVLPESARLDSKGNILLSGVFRGTTDFGGPPLISSHNAFFLAKLKPDGSHAFSRGLSVDDLDGALVSRISVLPDDSVVLSGSYEGAIDFGSGDALTAPTPEQDGCFVARFLSDGELRWRRNLFTGTGLLFAVDSSATPDGDVVLVGYFGREVSFGSSTLTTASTDAFIVKLDGESGNVQWSLQLGDPNATTTTIEATAVAVDPDGNIVVGGRFTGFTEVGFDESSAPSPSGTGSFVIKLTPTGKRDWSVVIQGEGDAWGADIDVDARGDLVAAAAFRGAIDIATRGVRGAQRTSGLADSDLLLVKLSSAGTHLWSLRFGDSLPQVDIDTTLPLMSPFGLHVAADAAGDIVLGAGLAGAVDFGGGLLGGRQDRDWTIAKLSAGGEHIWSRRFGDAATGQGIAGIDTDPATNALVAVGINDGVLDFGNEIKIAVAGGFNSVVAKVDLQRVGR
ncbi:SBBP repeat-containing protein [Sorangium sp. So ce394]|uniref:SBBP repeat-containing protein n=1 Tax=Sorangium sp. So ce394 TaxID=3133310 RepID=UPI003F5B01B8